MAQLTVEQDTLVLTLRGLDKLWSFKSRLTVPLSHVQRVALDRRVARRLWKGFRAPGTSIPWVIAAGTFIDGHKRVFWAVHFVQPALVIDLVGERYDQLIVAVPNPTAVLQQLQAVLPSSGG